MSKLPVAVVASEEDRLAARVARAVEERGRTALYVDGPAAARLFTIRVSGPELEVLPELALFVRQSAWWRTPAPQSTDDRFIVGENFAMLWAATALTPAMVINRPSRDRWFDHLTAGTIAPLVDGETDGRLAEVYASGPAAVSPVTAPEPKLGAQGGRVLWGKSADRSQGPVADLDAQAPLRARWVDPGALYELVTVVGERAFLSTTDPRSTELQLSEQSIALAARACVHFATVTWAVTDDAAVPVRFNADVRDSDTRFAWADIEAALCEDLVA